jgi:hypothetical protein
MTTARTIAKNTVVLIAAQVINIVITLVYLAYTTRYLQAEGFGILSFAQAFTSMFVFISDPGLSTLMTREVSRDKSLGGKYLGTIVGRPMPRFTRLPSFNSRATRFAIRTLSSISSGPPNDVMNADKGSRHCVRRYDPGRDDVFGLGDDGPAGCSHDDVKVARCQRIFKIIPQRTENKKSVFYRPVRFAFNRAQLKNIYK